MLSPPRRENGSRHIVIELHKLHPTGSAGPRQVHTTFSGLYQAGFFRMASAPGFEFCFAHAATESRYQPERPRLVTE